MKIDMKDVVELCKTGKVVYDKLTKNKSESTPQKELATSGKSTTISENMTHEEENAAIEKTKSKLSGHSLSTPVEVMSTLKAFTEAATDAVKFCEVQETKREEIRANRDVRLKQLEAQREIILEYLNRSFDERRYLFQKQFEVVDYALRSGNTEQLALSLQSINDLAKSSPFKALADIGNVQRKLSQEGSTFDI